MNSIYQNALIIKGPEQDDFEKKSSLIADRISNIVRIGDGEVDLINDNGEGIYADIITQYNTHSSGKTLVIVDAHGLFDDGEHIIQFATDAAYSTEDLFSDLTENINTPFDILFLACNGRGAQELVHSLPKGTKVMFTSAHDESSITGDYFHLLRSFPDDKELSIGNLFNTFLYEMGCPVKPALITAGRTDMDLTPYEYYETNISKSQLSETLVSAVKEKILGFCEQDTQCVDGLNSSLETVTAIGDINQYQHLTFGPKLQKIDGFFEELNQFANNTSFWGCMMEEPALNLLNSKLGENELPFTLRIETICDDLDEESDEGIADTNEFIYSSNDRCIVRALQDYIQDNQTIDSVEHNAGMLLVSSFVQEHYNESSCPELI